MIILKVIKNHIAILGFALQVLLVNLYIYFNYLLSDISYDMLKNIIILVLVFSFVSAIYSWLKGKHIFLSIIIVILTPLISGIFVLNYFISLM